MLRFSVEGGNFWRGQWPGLSLALYGAYDPLGTDTNGHSDRFPAAAFDAVSLSDYAAVYPADLRWLAGAQAQIGLFKIEIQKQFTHLYAHRVYGTFAWRGAVFDVKDASVLPAYSLPKALRLPGSWRLPQSLLLRFGVVMGTAIVTAVPITFTPVVAVGLRLSDALHGPFWQAVTLGITASVAL
jgi:hypothetical protein